MVRKSANARNGTRKECKTDTLLDDPALFPWELLRVRL